MAKEFLHGPLKRIGFLLICAGFLGIAVGTAFELPDLNRPPNSPEFNAAWATQWQEDYRQSHKQSALPAIDPAFARPESGFDRRSLELAPPLPPLPPRDPDAKWTIPLYSKHLLDNLDSAFSSPASWSQFALSYGTKAAFIGLLLRLACHPIIGRFYRWILHGKAEA